MSPFRNGRWPLVFTVAASLLVSVVGAPSLTHADPPPDPVARLQVIVKKVHIRDDRDLFSAGDMEYLARLCTEDSDGVCGSGPGMYTGYPFQASTGDDVTLDHLLPMRGDTVTGDITLETGMPVYAGQHYQFYFTMEDKDFVDGDDMGRITAQVDEVHGWGIGTYTVRSIHSDGSPGDYDLTFEIRRAPLPELLNRGIHIIDAGDGQFYCDTVQNVGEQSTGPAPLTIKADGVLVKSTTLKELAVGETTEYCVLRSELPARQHQLSFMVDEGRQIPEMNETDNYYEWKIPALAPAAAPGPAPDGGAAGVTSSPEPKPSEPEPKPKPNEAQADLTVRAIKINGQAPDGKDDCKVGKNGVTVVVKNAGKGDAGSFAVRLSVDGNDLTASVDGLDAGQEREVSFDDVPLKAGAHALTAAADPEHAVAESKDDNNELKVTATCKAN